MAIIGPRRSRKTYFLLNILRNNKNTLYVDLEHSVFREITHKEFFETKVEKVIIY
ncbi:MAG: hypothetical protein QXW01_00955 [Candidatus Aenigmatarchaeota archaeon]